MEILNSFLLSILASIVAACICKWLNGKQRSNRPCLSAGIVSIEKPTDGTPWVFRVLDGHHLIPLACVYYIMKLFTEQMAGEFLLYELYFQHSSHSRSKLL